MKTTLKLILSACLCVAAAPSAAQTFGGGEIPSNAGNVSESAKQMLSPSAPVSVETVTENKTAASAPVPSQNSGNDFFIPAGELINLNRPTSDGSQRGTAAIFEMDEKGIGHGTSKIFLYTDNFQISRSINGLTTCDMRFIVLTSLNSRLISLDAKLVWPEISTAVSFANVMPNTPTYYNYTLIGDGCYSMDKMPNIIVNRCRVRRMSSAECANKIVWLSKSK